MKFRFLKPWDPDVCDRQMEKGIREKEREGKKADVFSDRSEGSYFLNLAVYSSSCRLWYPSILFIYLFIIIS